MTNCLLQILGGDLWDNSVRYENEHSLYCDRQIALMAYSIERRANTQIRPPVSAQRSLN